MVGEHLISLVIMGLRLSATVSQYWISILIGLLVCAVYDGIIITIHIASTHSESIHFAYSSIVSGAGGVGDDASMSVLVSMYSITTTTTTTTLRSFTRFCSCSNQCLRQTQSEHQF